MTDLWIVVPIRIQIAMYAVAAVLLTVWEMWA